ncbi:MAG TPA: Dabb family protein [Phnomibacter sp.]|nr:Dabb family protein [Phnomibacter sp.]
MRNPIQNRRRFVQWLLALPVAGVAIPNNKRRQKNTKQPMLVHHVFFWLKEPGNQSHRQQLITGLRTLASIPQVKQLLVGTAAGTESRSVVDHSYDVSELMYFNNLQDQATYQQHPTHQDFVQQYSHLWQKVVVYDTMMEKA